jgi:ferredoxin
MTFRVVVEADVCENNGVCERLAPDIFALGDDDREPVQVLLDPIDDDRRAAADQAARSCPKQAITVVDGPAPAT